MKPLRSDFRLRSRPPRWLWLFASGLLVCSLVLAVGAWLKWQRVVVERQALLDAITQESQKKSVPELTPPPLYLASAREMLAERSLPWIEALTALESSAMVGVTPTSVELIPADRAVRVELVFSDYPKLLEYIDSLNAGEPDLIWTLTQTDSRPATPSTAVVVAHSVRDATRKRP